MGAKVNESARSIRALKRGLEVLSVLNRLERAAVHTLASALRLPRTTTFRLLETLRGDGYVERDAADDCYRPTIRVRALSDGFDDEAMAAHLAKPLLTTLGLQIAWPLALATPAGATMMIRETSCREAAGRDGVFALEPHGVGMRVPMLSTAAGRVYLAHCSKQERDALLELLSRSSLPEDRLARNRIEVERLLNETRAQGFGMAHGERRVADEVGLALPVRHNERALATLGVRFMASALPLRSAVEQFLPQMRRVVQQIEAQFS